MKPNSTRTSKLHKWRFASNIIWNWFFNPGCPTSKSLGETWWNHVLLLVIYGGVKVGRSPTIFEMGIQLAVPMSFHPGGPDVAFWACGFLMYKQSRNLARLVNQTFQHVKWQFWLFSYPAFCSFCNPCLRNLRELQQRTSSANQNCMSLPWNLDIVTI